MNIEFTANTGAQLRDQILDFLGPETVLEMLRFYYRPRGYIVNVEPTPSQTPAVPPKANYVGLFPEPYGQPGYVPGQAYTQPLDGDLR